MMPMTALTEDPRRTPREASEDGRRRERGSHVIVLICTHLLVQMSSSHLHLQTTAQLSTLSQLATAAAAAQPQPPTLKPYTCHLCEVSMPCSEPFPVLILLSLQI